MRLLKITASSMLNSMRRLNARRLARSTFKVDLLGHLDKGNSLQDFLVHFRSREKPLFFFDNKVTQLLEDLSQLNRVGNQAIIKDADQICSHVFEMLGSGKINVDMEPRKIDWHRDFKSGMRWEPKTFYIDTEIIRGGGSDIKVPWELSRFQHLPTLGNAYWLTGDEKYTLEFISEIEDWIDSNPPQYGINWSCAMDVSIRVVNWIWGYYFFKDSPNVKDQFMIKLLTSLLIHGKHIRNNLERNWRGVNTNHYLSNIVGLVYLGVMLPEFRQAREWRDFGMRELVKEMGRQVYADGADYEGSTSYHRLVAELFLSATLLCLKNGVTFPTWYMQRLERMIEFALYYTKPDGTAPQIGDDDDGRLHILSDYGTWDKCDHRYLLSVGAVLFKREDFRQAAECFHEEAFWLLDGKAVKEFNKIQYEDVALSSKDFPDGGYYIMRINDNYMIIDCLPAGNRVPMGHKHNSRLSFDLYAGDKSFIVDPGSYVYTTDKDMRNLFRSTGYHNTVVVDDTEQNRLLDNELFNMRRDAATIVNDWRVTDDYDFLDAEHHGYNRLREPVIHRRKILFNKKESYWLISDNLTGKGEHRFELFFHFAPLEVIFDREESMVATTVSESINLAVVPLEIDDLSAEILKGWVSYQYGVKIEAPILKYSKKGKVPSSFCTLLLPYTGRFNLKKAMQKVSIERDRLILESK